MLYIGKDGRITEDEVGSVGVVSVPTDNKPQDDSSIWDEMAAAIKEGVNDVE